VVKPQSGGSKRETSKEEKKKLPKTKFFGVVGTFKTKNWSPRKERENRLNVGLNWTLGFLPWENFGKKFLRTKGPPP